MVDLPKINVVQMVTDFYRESERVLLITHKPRGQEYKQIAFITAIGMAIIGVAGFIVTMIAFFLRGGRL